MGTATVVDTAFVNVRAVSLTVQLIPLVAVTGERTSRVHTGVITDAIPLTLVDVKTCVVIVPNLESMRTGTLVTTWVINGKTLSKEMHQYIMRRVKILIRVQICLSGRGFQVTRRRIRN